MTIPLLAPGQPRLAFGARPGASGAGLACRCPWLGRSRAGRALPDPHLQDHGRPHPGPPPGGGRRQGAFRQGDRGSPAQRRSRYRRAFHEGHAGGAADRPFHCRGAAARRSARSLHRATARPSTSFPRARGSAPARSGRQAQALAASPRSQNRVLARQCRNPAFEARARRGRCHHARARRACRG